MKSADPPRLIVVGGGAGGAELACRLGDKLGRRGLAHVTLIDVQLTHLWKPLLHEVAAGTLDSAQDDIDYLALARQRGFQFRLGRFDGIDRERKLVHLAATVSAENGLVIPERTFPYDLLVIAVGSVSNDFGIDGVRQHCLFLDNHAQADRFQRRLLENFLRAQTQQELLREGQLNVAIIGAGATGVELAAELHGVTRLLPAYGLDRIDPERDVTLTLVEAHDRILPMLPKRIAEGAQRQLKKLKVNILTGKRVMQVTAEGLTTHDGQFVSAETKVWAAGIKAPDFLKDIGGLETNRANQLLVRRTLQTTRDDDIYAIGDCASCPRPGDDRPVPATAQAAHQQAALLLTSLPRRLDGRSLPEFVYRDHGSLVSLGKRTAIGYLMGNLGHDIRLEGWIARLAYRSLYRQHQSALLGPLRTALLWITDMLAHQIRPRLKLH